MTVVSSTIEKRDWRARREAELGERQMALPDKHDGVILADPSWRFESYSRIPGMDRAAESGRRDQGARRCVHHQTKLRSVPLGDGPMLPQAHEMMAAWRFAYKSNFVWAKNGIGTGFWNRNKHELLLIGMRGHVPAPASGTQAASLIEAPVRRYSEKSAVFYLVIERCFPTLPKIELHVLRLRCRATWMGRMGAGSADRSA
jgi:hypothetical protein